MIYRARRVIPRAGNVIENGEVLVREGEIAAVGVNLTQAHDGEPVRDLGNCVLMPGFVNAHSHVDYTAFRGAVDAVNLWDWVKTVAYGPRRTLDPEIVELSALLGAAECALSGITCVGDSTYSGASLEALQTVGLRSVVYREIFGQSLGAEYAEPVNNLLREVKRVQSECSSLVRVGISPHSIYTSHRDMLEYCGKICADLGIPIALHLAETLAETNYSLYGTGPLADMRRELGYEPVVSGLTPARYLSEIGLLREDVCLGHCIHLTAEEVKLVAESGAGVAYCPRSNAYLGAGIAPAADLVRAGARLGLGTDSSASSLTIDFFEEMRFAIGMQRACTKDAGVITAKDVLEAATVGGANALGLADKTGRLEPGYRADLVAVDIGDSLPGENPHLSVMRRSPKDVSLVVVDGVEIVREGSLLTFDIEECRQQLSDAMENRHND